MRGGRAVLQIDQAMIDLGGFRLSASFDLAPGSKTAVIGPSGAGKSTLLLMIAGFLVPKQGRILWQGRDITHNPAQARPVSMLFQDQNLFPHMTLEENVVLGLTAGRRPTPDQRALAQASLERVGLDGLFSRKPAQVSGGQKARVALARVLLQARPILLLDEPFSALDAALRRDMLSLVKDVAQDIHATVMMVSHDLQDAALFADQVITVESGVAHAPVPATAFFAGETATRSPSTE